MQLCRADLISRQFQRLLGPLWWILEPTLMSLAYYFLTTKVMAYSSGKNHFLFIFVATTVWRFFSRCLDQSTMSYVSVGYVLRQTDFPLLAANFAVLFTELIFLFVGFSVVVLVAAFNGIFPGTALLVLPILILSLSVITLGIMVFLSCLGVYIRDIPPILNLTLTVLFFVSPALYDAKSLPPKYAFLKIIDPFYYFFPSFRAVIIDNQIPDLLPSLVWLVVGAIVLACAINFFNRVRLNFLRVL